MFRIDVKRALSVWMSGVVVYVLVVACSSGGGSSGAAGTSGGGAAGAGGAMAGTGGTSGTSASGMGGQTFMDVLTDPVPDADANPQSGSRLKAKYFLGEDGSKEYEHWIDTTGGGSYDLFRIRNAWYDSTRDETCAGQLASDNMTRCLPIDAVLWQNMYKDAACTQRAVEVKAGPGGCPQPPPKYARSIELTACPPVLQKMHYYPIGAVNVPMPKVYLSQFDGSCAQGQVNNTSAYYDLGAEVAATEFVMLTPNVEP